VIKNIRKMSSKRALIGLFAFIALKWTIVGAVAAIAMISMQAPPTESSAYSSAE